MEKLYKENLKQALRSLITVNEAIYNSMVDIITQGELKDWNNSVPVGEEHQFHFEIFDNSKDVNIQLLVELMYKVDATFNEIKALNNINLNE